MHSLDEIKFLASKALTIFILSEIKGCLRPLVSSLSIVLERNIRPLKKAPDFSETSQQPTISREPTYFFLTKPTKYLNSIETTKLTTVPIMA